jgi:ParB family transcriptional regulator, chromosome partitioning protein
MAHVSNNTGEQEHYTPHYIIEMAREVMRWINLDPASNDIAQQWVKADTYYTKENNGLEKDWNYSGNMWMNPPYARGLMDKFIEKTIESELQQYIILINNTTETAAGQKILKHSDLVCFPQKRIRFIKPDGSVGKAPLQGQMILYRGGRQRPFQKVFSQLGAVFYK